MATMSALEATDSRLGVMWRRQPISNGGGREVAVMAAGGPSEDEEEEDQRVPIRPPDTAAGLSPEAKPPAGIHSIRDSSATSGASRGRKTTFVAVAKVAKVSSCLQNQLSTDLEDFRAPTPRPMLPPTVPQLSESPMFQWKLSSPPPRRVSPIPSSYRPGSPQPRHEAFNCLSFTVH
jgi:hypothetical protein